MRYLIGLSTDPVPPHKHNQYELIFCTNGNGTCHTEAGEMSVSEGDCIIVPSNCEHASCFAERYDRIHISGNFNHIFDLSVPVFIPKVHAKEGLILARIIYENRFADPEYILALVNALVHCLVRCLEMEDPIRMKVNEMIEIITNTFYDSHFDLGALLKSSGYAPDYIRAKFKKITGKTPTDFLTEVRIHHACYLIDVYKKTIPLSLIAEKSGYADYLYFSRRFKQITGISPRAYMKI